MVREDVSVLLLLFGRAVNEPAGVSTPGQESLCCWTDTCQGHPRDSDTLQVLPQTGREIHRDTLKTGDVRSNYNFPLSQQIGGVRTRMNCSIQNTPFPLNETGQKRQKLVPRASRIPENVGLQQVSHLVKT